MNLPSEAQTVVPHGLDESLSGVAGSGAPVPFSTFEDQAYCGAYAPLEFRSLHGKQGGGTRRSAGAGREAMRDAFEVPEYAEASAEELGRGMEQREAEARHATEAARRDGFQAGAVEGHRLAQDEMRGEIARRVAQEQDGIVAVVNEFGVARDRYFSDAEQQVVKLALAIAARVLHRESQVDELLLSAAVRVALERMADQSGVVLRAPEAEVSAWEKMFLAMEAGKRPQVVGDGLLAIGECVLETRVGTVDLGVRVQLEEIEKGFFDLLNHRPAPLDRRSNA